MPIPVIRSVSSKAVILTPAGGSTGLVLGAALATKIPPVTHNAIQICGFIPLIDCSVVECRSFIDSCYVNPVFGRINDGKSTYENDISTFIIDDQMKRITSFTLQKKDERLKTWSDSVVIFSSNHLLIPFTAGYCIPYNYNFFTAHKTYIGVQINWGAVLAGKGPGQYRLKVFSPNLLGPGRPNKFPYCLISEEFLLKPFNCNLADRTVKFEANISGRIGSITTDGMVFDLCNMNYFDSVRVKGFFGFETTGYDEIMREAQTGIMDRVRDEAIQKFDFIGHPMPKYIHDRFKVYGGMADSLYVSDYNLNNADYDVKHKSIVKAAGYEPKQYQRTRLQTVRTQFKEGIQSVIKSSSCQNLR